MVNEFIKLFSGYDGDFGIADMSKATLDAEKNKIKPDYEWSGRPITPQDYENHIQGKISIGIQPCKLHIFKRTYTNLRFNRSFKSFSVTTRFKTNHRNFSKAERTKGRRQRQHKTR